jgi:hypothetical protein
MRSPSSPSSPPSPSSSPSPCPPRTSARQGRACAIALLAALAAVAGCERKTPRGRAADPPPAPVVAAPPDAAIDAVDAAPDGPPVTMPEPKLTVRPGELPFLVALRGKLAEKASGKERDQIAAVDLSDTARGDSTVLAFMALDIATRVNLRATADHAMLDSAPRLGELAELRTEHDIDQLAPIINALGEEYTRVNDLTQCRTEGCPEVPILCLMIFDRAIAGIVGAKETLGGPVGPADSPWWIGIAENLGEALSEVCSLPRGALSPQQVLEKLAARARAR